MTDDYRKLPEGPRGRDFVEDEPDPFNPRIEKPTCMHSAQSWYVTKDGLYGCNDCNEDRRSLRWQMKGPKGETFIMYGPQIPTIERALKAGYTDFQESGYYDFGTNTIVNPKDGDWTFQDNRKSGGGSQG